MRRVSSDANFGQLVGNFEGMRSGNSDSRVSSVRTSGDLLQLVIMTVSIHVSLSRLVSPW